MKSCAVEGCDRPHDSHGYCRGHAARLRRGVDIGGPFPTSPIDRFMAKIEVDGDCWIWTGATDGDGRYGSFYDSDTGKVVRAHRWAMEHLAQLDVPDVIDHLCRRTLCVNPDHLDRVTQRENILRGGWGGGSNARKTHCRHGHEFTEANTLRKGPEGRHRQCRTCTRRWGREAQRRYRERQRNVMAA